MIEDENRRGGFEAPDLGLVAAEAVGFTVDDWGAGSRIGALFERSVRDDGG